MMPTFFCMSFMSTVETNLPWSLAVLVLSCGSYMLERKTGHTAGAAAGDVPCKWVFRLSWHIPSILWNEIHRPPCEEQRRRPFCALFLARRFRALGRRAFGRRVK